MLQSQNPICELTRQSYKSFLTSKPSKSFDSSASNVLLKNERTKSEQDLNKQDLFLKSHPGKNNLKLKNSNSDLKLNYENQNIENSFSPGFKNLNDDQSLFSRFNNFMKSTLLLSDSKSYYLNDSRPTFSKIHNVESLYTKNLHQIAPLLFVFEVLVASILIFVYLLIVA